MGSLVRQADAREETVEAMDEIVEINWRDYRYSSYLLSAQTLI